MHNGGLPVVDRAMQSHYYQKSRMHPQRCVQHHGLCCSAFSVGDQQAERRAVPRRQEMESVQYA